MKKQLTSISLILMCLPALAGSGNKDFQKNYPVNFSQVKIHDQFWSERLATHANVTLGACIDQCENQTARIRNFAIAAGIEEGVYKGIVYDDSDVYKMIEGASYSLTNNPNPALEAKMDDIINKIAGAQCEDGYLMTYYKLGDFSRRWSNMDKHEMYCAGHLTEAAIAYYNATGKRVLLDVAIKYADHIDATFGAGKRGWVPGHQEIELALVKLYRTTGEERYLRLSNWLLDQRGRNKADWQDKGYYQDLVPVADLSKISGHAVRAMYMFTGMADIAAITSNEGYIGALDRLWDDVVFTKMYLTGGIGSSHHNEGFTEDYDLPNDAAYCETCASVGMIFWNQRMNMLKGDARYIDILEKCMYNGALAGISISGDRFFYVNPLSSDGTHHRKAWYGTACCPSQISRFLPSIGNYIYAFSDDAVWINLFMGSETNVKNNSFNVALKQETSYPWDGAVKISVNPVKSCRFDMKIRIPSWCKNYRYDVNNTTSGAKMEDGYLVINRIWKKGDIITIDFDMPVRVVEADPRVKANIGKRAVQRGPIVYCTEECDNKDFDSLMLDAKTEFKTAFDKNLLGGVVTIDARTRRGNIMYVPYYAWDNREAGRMNVWVDYR